MHFIERMSHWTSTESPVATQILTEEERRIVLSQITSLDRFAAASDNFSNGSRAIVCVPPRAEGDNERWIAVNPLSQQIDFNIRQPDQNRTVLYASENKYGCNSYYYNDQLSCCIIWTIIATVIFSILTTPVILLCCIPMIKKMKQVTTCKTKGCCIIL